MHSVQLQDANSVFSEHSLAYVSSLRTAYEIAMLYWLVYVPSLQLLNLATDFQDALRELYAAELLSN
jgi:hypothetical protein